MRTVSIIAFLVAGALPAVAQDAGRNEYIQSCATCHGINAVGDGPLAEFMSVHVPDLTLLKQNNDGVFPKLEMIHMVDGRSGIGGHGREMPIWGGRFKEESIEYTGKYGAEVIARGRVLALVEYLESIQK